MAGYTVLFSGGASAVKKPGHFEVRKSSSQLIPESGVHFFPQKSRRPYAADCFTVKTEQKIKRSDVVTFFFNFLFTLSYRSKATGRAEPGRRIFQPGHLSWRALV